MLHLRAREAAAATGAAGRRPDAAQSRCSPSGDSEQNADAAPPVLACSPASGGACPANELALSAIRDGQPIEAVFRAEPGRTRILEATFMGKKFATGGRFANGQESPWTHKCAGS